MPWWLASYWTDWSKEEGRVYSLIWGGSAVVFVFLFFTGIWLLKEFGGSASVANVTALIVSIPSALCVSQLICRWLLPDLVIQADMNAKNRLAKKRAAVKDGTQQLANRSTAQTPLVSGQRLPAIAPRFINVVWMCGSAISIPTLIASDYLSGSNRTVAECVGIGAVVGCIAVTAIYNKIHYGRWNPGRRASQ